MSERQGRNHDESRGEPALRREGAGGAVADKRKSRQLLARWHDARGQRVMPPWETHRGVAEDLEDYCIAGHFGHKRAEAVTSRIGAFFLDHLEPERAAAPVDPYPAAVVMGIVRSLGAQLLHSTAPILHEGEFQTDQGIVVRYRTVVLPFGESGQRPDHWLALGSWRSGSSSGALRAA